MGLKGNLMANLFLQSRPRKRRKDLQVLNQIGRMPAMPFEIVKASGGPGAVKR